MPVNHFISYFNQCNDEWVQKLLSFLVTLTMFKEIRVCHAHYSEE